MENIKSIFRKLTPPLGRMAPNSERIHLPPNTPAEGWRTIDSDRFFIKSKPQHMDSAEWASIKTSIKSKYQHAAHVLMVQLLSTLPRASTKEDVVSHLQNACLSVNRKFPVEWSIPPTEHTDISTRTIIIPLISRDIVINENGAFAIIHTKGKMRGTYYFVQPSANQVDFAMPPIFAERYKNFGR